MANFPAGNYKAGAGFLFNAQLFSPGKIACARAASPYSLPDTELAENAAEHIVGGHLARDFAQGVQGRAAIIGIS
jgi:hypothetical protein